MMERPTTVVTLGKSAFFAKDAPLGAAYQEDTGGWWMRCPQCGYRAPLDHETTVHEDGTLTFSPSLVCPRNIPNGEGDNLGPSCAAHYFVNRSQLSGEW